METKKTLYSVRLDEKTLKLLKTKASQECQAESEIIRNAIREYCQNVEVISCVSNTGRECGFVKRFLCPICFADLRSNIGAYYCHHCGTGLSWNEAEKYLKRL